MTDSLFDRCGWNPTEVHARLYGRRPRGIIVVTAEQRARAEREAREHEAREREARAEAPQPPAVGVKGEENDPPRACLGEVAAAPAADGGVQAEVGDAEADGPTTTEAAPRRSLSPSELGEDRNEPTEAPPLMVTPELKAWIERHWDTLNALEAADALPDLGAPAAKEPPPPPVHVGKGDRWNKHKMAGFLRELAATHNVTAAAKAVGMSRQSAHRLRNRLKGQPFDVAWEAASRHGYDALFDTAIERAIHGVEVPHYANGELVGTHRKFNDHLLLGLLKLRNAQGAPQAGRYGAAAEWMSERWDAALERIETGAVDWSDEHRALGEAERVALDLPGAKGEIDALIKKHLPGQGYQPRVRK